MLDVLSNMGLENALSKSADYSELVNMSMTINKIMQKTKIEIDEQGTIAVSVSVVGGEVSALPPKEVYFNLNHPFGFIIRETSTNAIIAMGKIAEF